MSGLGLALLDAARAPRPPCVGIPRVFFGCLNDNGDQAGPWTPLLRRR